MKTGFNILILLLCLIAGAQAQPEPQNAPNATDAQGRKQGEWVKRYPTGKKYYEGQFKDGQPVGTFVYYDQDERLQKKMVFHPDSVQGTFYHENGKLMAAGIYIDQKREGKWTFYDGNQVRSSVEHYKAGKRNGASLSFYLNGRVAGKKTYVNDVAQGEYVEYFENKNKMLEATYVDGNFEGEAVYYHPNGKVRAEGKYINAVKDGNWIYYLDNGAVETQELYKLGSLEKRKRENGDFIEYYDSGIPKEKGTYRSGAKHGPFIRYYDAGKFMKQAVENWQETGNTETVEKLEGQKVKMKGVYSEGQFHGKIIHYNQKGKVDKTETYANGVLVKK